MSVGPHERAVVEVLRANAWLWLAPDPVALLARVKRRTTRHHLARLVAAGLAEEARVYAVTRYRWRAGSESEFDALLPPPADPPTHCRRGHALDGENLWVRPDGSRACFECGEWTWRGSAPVEHLRR